MEKIKRLVADAPKVRLALSLHAPTQELRRQIVPSARTFHIDELMEAIDLKTSVTGVNVLIEYVLLHGVNDSEEVAHQVGKLLKGKNVKVNLIPFNPVYGINFTAPPREAVETFSQVLQQYGLYTLTRREMGSDPIKPPSNFPRPPHARMHERH